MAEKLNELPITFLPHDPLIFYQGLYGAPFFCLILMIAGIVVPFIFMFISGGTGDLLF